MAISLESAQKLRQLVKKIPARGLRMEVLLQENECGTKGCLAGWSAHFAGCRPYGGFSSYVITPEGERVGTAEFAKENLGLTDMQASDLFFLNWPNGLWDEYGKINKPGDRKRFLAKVVENFIETGGWGQ